MLHIDFIWPLNNFITIPIIKNYGQHSQIIINIVLVHINIVIICIKNHWCIYFLKWFNTHDDLTSIYFDLLLWELIVSRLVYLLLK